MRKSSNLQNERTGTFSSLKIYLLKKNQCWAQKAATSRSCQNNPTLYTARRITLYGTFQPSLLEAKIIFWYSGTSKGPLKASVSEIFVSGPEFANQKMTDFAKIQNVCGSQRKTMRRKFPWNLINLCKRCLSKRLSFIWAVPLCRKTAF